MEYCVSFPASSRAAEQARHAEALGFSSIGFFDSPALESDVWITIASAAQATESIKVGTEVLIPHLRHPMVQAAAIATVEHLAPGRLFVGVGTGFTGRRVLGQPPLKWAYIERFLRDVRGLLDGEDVVIDGAVCRMMHPSGFGPDRPIRVPFLVAANGPRGIALAHELGDGLIFGGPPDATPEGFETLQIGAGGIALAEGESPTSPRVLEKATMLFALQYHLAYDGYHYPPLAVERLPHGAEWLEMIEAFPADRRHLHVHDLHMAGTNAHDRAFAERHPDEVIRLAEAACVTGAQFRDLAQSLAERGATRIGCGVSFADWERDMERYAEALGL